VVQGYELVNGRVALSDVGGTGVGVAFYVRNLFDEDYDLGSVGSSAGAGFESFYSAPPRTIGVSLRYDFGG